MMVYCAWENHVFGLCSSYNVSKKNTVSFRKMDLFPFSGKMMGAPTLLDPLERASLNHWTLDDGQSPEKLFFQVHLLVSFSRLG
jgi:hypothetical protein